MCPEHRENILYTVGFPQQQTAELIQEANTKGKFHESLVILNPGAERNFLLAFSSPFGGQRVEIQQMSIDNRIIAKLVQKLKRNGI